MTNYQMIIFDFDGTICDTRVGIAACISKTFESNGIQTPDPCLITKTLQTGTGLRETLLSLLSTTIKSNNTNIDCLVAKYRQIYNAGLGLELEKKI